MSLYYFPELETSPPFWAKPWYEAMQPTVREATTAQPAILAIPYRRGFLEDDIDALFAPPKPVPTSEEKADAGLNTKSFDFGLYL